MGEIVLPIIVGVLSTAVVGLYLRDRRNSSEITKLKRHLRRLRIERELDHAPDPPSDPPPRRGRRQMRAEGRGGSAGAWFSDRVHGHPGLTSGAAGIASTALALTLLHPIPGSAVSADGAPHHRPEAQPSPLHFEPSKPHASPGFSGEADWDDVTSVAESKQTFTSTISVPAQQPETGEGGAGTPGAEPAPPTPDTGRDVPERPSAPAEDPVPPQPPREPGNGEDGSDEPPPPTSPPDPPEPP